MRAEISWSQTDCFSLFLMKMTRFTWSFYGLVFHQQFVQVSSTAQFSSEEACHEKTSVVATHTSVLVNIHQSALLINLSGDTCTLRNILEPGLFELDRKRLYAFRCPKLHLRLSRIAIRNFAGY